MLGSALLTGVGAALAPASLISVVIFLSNLFLISTYGVLVGALRPIAFPFTGAGVANALVSVGFFNPILVVGLLIPGAITGFGVEPFTALLVSFAPPRADFNAPDFGSGTLAVLIFGTTEGRLDAILDAVDEDSGRDDFNGIAVDGLFIPIDDEEVLGFSIDSTNYCNLVISLFIVSIYS